MDKTGTVAEVERRRDQAFAKVKRLQQLVTWRRFFSLEERGMEGGRREGRRRERGKGVEEGREEGRKG